MFLSTGSYAFLDDISKNHEVILSEFEQAVGDNDFLREILEGGSPYIDKNLDAWVSENGFHPDQIGFDIRSGRYSAITLFKEQRPVRYINRSSCFKETIHLLGGVERLHLAAFFIMMPESSLATHSHTRSHLIHHTLLNDLVDGCCEMSCNGKITHLETAGDTALFDYSLPHGSVNRAKNARINLVVDFEAA